MNRDYLELDRQKLFGIMEDPASYILANAIHLKRETLGEPLRGDLLICNRPPAPAPRHPAPGPPSSWLPKTSWDFLGLPRTF